MAPPDNILSPAFLAFMCAIFAWLGVTIVYDPDEALRGHGLGFAGAEPAVYAEIRAFYGGCFATLAFVCARGVADGARSTGARRRDALDAVCCLLGVFATVRAYSYVVDGPPSRTNVYLLWSAEAAGAVVAGLLGVVERNCAAVAGLVDAAVDRLDKVK